MRVLYLYLPLPSVELPRWPPRRTQQHDPRRIRADAEPIRSDFVSL